MEIIITKNEIRFPSIDKAFTQNTTISIAANMREALKEMTDIDTDEVTVELNSPVIIVPKEQLDEEDPTALYNLSVAEVDEEIIVVQQPIEFPSQGGGDASIVALFAVSKDLNTVIEDHFKNYEFLHAGICKLIVDIPSEESHVKEGVAKILSLKNQLLTASFYDNIMYAYAMKQGRLNFFNRYEATNAHDCAYMLLSIWKQLGYSQLKDELHLTGEISFMEDLKEVLSEFIKNVNQ